MISPEMTTSPAASVATLFTTQSSLRGNPVLHGALHGPLPPAPDDEDVLLLDELPVEGHIAPDDEVVVLEDELVVLEDEDVVLEDEDDAVVLEDEDDDVVSPPPPVVEELLVPPPVPALEDDAAPPDPLLVVSDVPLEQPIHMPSAPARPTRQVRADGALAIMCFIMSPARS
jgi:hypothetical protein